jgi:indole-3-acetate monooxygenase
LSGTSRGVAMNNAAARILEGVRDLAPKIAARAPEIEGGRRLPNDLLAQLRTLGLFRMLVPRRLAGYALDAPSVIEILTELASADGATAWTVMIGCHAPLVFAGFQNETFESIYARGPDVIGGGSTTPRGTIEPHDTGWRVGGRWGLASGCEHADWLFGLCVEKRAGTGNTAEPPRLRYIALPASSWRVVDTWRAAGLRGTGSHDIELSDVHVPAECSVSFLDFSKNGESNLQEPGFIALHLQKILHIAAIAVGIAQGALKELTQVAQQGKRRLFTVNALADMPVFQHRLGRAEADVNAAQAYLRDRTRSYWSEALTGRVPASRDIDICQAATWIADTCTCAVDACFKAAGASAVYETSPLQRRLRDIHTLGQHILVHEDFFTGAGAIRLGRDSGVPFVRSET